MQSFFLCRRNNASSKGGLVTSWSSQNKNKYLDHLDKMAGERLVGLFLLLWMTATVSGQQDLLNNFVHDLISTFNLTLPTILYDSDEPPQICYENTPKRRVLCLQVTEEEQKISIDHNDSGMFRAAISSQKLGFMLKGQMRQNTTGHGSVSHLYP